MYIIVYSMLIAWYGDHEDGVETLISPGTL